MLSALSKVARLELCLSNQVALKRVKAPHAARGYESSHRLPLPEHYDFPYLVSALLLLLF